MSKTLLIATQQTLKNHAGKEVDDYILVEAIPTPEMLPATANLIRNKIRQIVIDSKKESGEVVSKVSVEVDATPPWRVVLVGLAETMFREEGLEIILPDDFNMKSRSDEKSNPV